jgi:hypothetical protein
MLISPILFAGIIRAKKYLDVWIAILLDFYPESQSIGWETMLAFVSFNVPVVLIRLPGRDALGCISPDNMGRR